MSTRRWCESWTPVAQVRLREASTEKLFEPRPNIALSSLDVDQLVATGRATHQCHGRASYAERRRDRPQDSLRCLALYRPGCHRDHQRRAARTVVPATDHRPGRTRPDPQQDSHGQILACHLNRRVPGRSVCTPEESTSQAGRQARNQPWGPCSRRPWRSSMTICGANSSDTPASRCSTPSSRALRGISATPNSCRKVAITAWR